VRKLSLGWQLYLLACAAMFPGFLISNLRSGRFQENPLLGFLALIIVCLGAGLFAFAVAQRTYRKAEHGEVSINQARIAVAWPGAVLFVIMVVGYFIE
jgi:formate-dependent nitrite reductase membrane component NrfD